MTIILVQVWLWEVLWSFFSVQPLSHCWLSYKIHFLSHVTVWSRNGLLLLCRIREDNTSKRFFSLSVSSWGTYSQAFPPFQFASNAKWLEWSRFSSLAASQVVERGSALIYSQLVAVTSDGQPLCSSSRLSSPLPNFLNHHCTVHLLALPGPIVLLMLWVVSTALQLILNSNLLLV